MFVTGLNINIRKQSAIYSLSYQHLGKILVLSSKKDIEGNSISNSANDYSFLRKWGTTFRYGFASIGAGVNFREGTYAINCRTEGLFLDICSQTDTSKFGLPMEAEFRFGRYFGVGMYTRATLFPDDWEYLLGFRLSLGEFAKR